MKVGLILSPSRPIFQEGTVSFLYEEAEAHLLRSRRGFSSLDALWQVQLRSTNNATSAINGDGNLRILTSAERISPRNGTPTTTLLEKDIDAILLQTVTKSRVEPVPRLYHVFES